MQKKVTNIVGPWLLRRMFLTQRPWSVNTYLLPKTYHRCHVVPLRQCDINSINKYAAHSTGTPVNIICLVMIEHETRQIRILYRTPTSSRRPEKQVNRFLYCDQLEKPGPVIQYRSRSAGGLQVHDIESKSKAMLIRSFMETLCIREFAHFPLQEAIFRYFIAEDFSITKPFLPKCYSKDFLHTIRKTKQMGKNVEVMSSNDWYLFILNLKVLQEDEEQEDGSICRKEIKCKTEIKNPALAWSDIWYLAKIKGIINESRTFMWRLLHNLLPTEQRLHNLKKSPSPICQLYIANTEDDAWNHSFSSCSFSSSAMDFMVNAILIMVPAFTKEKSVFLQNDPVKKENTLLACVWIISESLQYIWVKRRSKEQLIVNDMRAILLAKLKVMSQTKTFQKHATKMTTILTTVIVISQLFIFVVVVS